MFTVCGREEGEGEGEKGIGFFFGGGGGMVFKGDPGEISRQRQNLKKGL